MGRRQWRGLGCQQGRVEGNCQSSAVFARNKDDTCIRRDILGIRQSKAEEFDWRVGRDKEWLRCRR
jgi:hypothetical protein